MRVRIYQPAKTAMQSGRAGMQQWLLEFDQAAEARSEMDPLMGWTSSANTRDQVRMRFDSMEEAVAYAQRQGYAYSVEAPKQRGAVRPKAYSDNFRYDRVGRWTH
jgi:ETC complex I subunit conserved region